MNRVEKMMRELPDDGLPDVAFSLDPALAAVVLVDPQAEFLAETGAAAHLYRESLQENATIANLLRLLAAAAEGGIPLFVCPHDCSPSDRDWDVGGTMELLMQTVVRRGARDPGDLSNPSGSAMGWQEDLKPFIEAESTVVCSPHKCYGPEPTDLRLQLHKRGVKQLLLAGASANLCVEAHLRSLLECGFEVVVVADATAAVKAPGLDGFLAAFVNYRMLASTVWCTAFAVAEIQRTTSQAGEPTSERH